MKLLTASAIAVLSTVGLACSSAPVATSESPLTSAPDAAPSAKLSNQGTTTCGLAGRHDGVAVWKPGSVAFSITSMGSSITPQCANGNETWTLDASLRIATWTGCVNGKLTSSVSDVSPDDVSRVVASMQSLRTTSITTLVADGPEMGLAVSAPGRPDAKYSGDRWFASDAPGEPTIDSAALYCVESLLGTIVGN